MGRQTLRLIFPLPQSGQDGEPHCVSQAIHVAFFFFFPVSKGWREEAWVGGVGLLFRYNTAIRGKCLVNLANSVPSLPGEE